MRKVFLFSFFIFLCTASSAQSHKLVLGYNIGNFTQAQHNLQAHAQIFNQISGDGLVKPLRVNGFYRGVVLGYKKSEDGLMMGIRWSTKKIVSSEGENADRITRWRLRYNSMSFEMGFGTDYFKLGTSIDCGFLKVQQKGSDKTSNKSNGWDPFYPGTNMVKSGGFVGSFTFFADIQLGRYLELRPFFQLPFTTADIADDALRTSFNYVATNYGFSLCFTPGDE